MSTDVPLRLHVCEKLNYNYFKCFRRFILKGNRAEAPGGSVPAYVNSLSSQLHSNCCRLLPIVLLPFADLLLFLDYLEGVYVTTCSELGVDGGRPRLTPDPLTAASFFTVITMMYSSRCRMCLRQQEVLSFSWPWNAYSGVRSWVLLTLPTGDFFLLQYKDY